MNRYLAWVRNMGRVVVVRREARKFGRENVAIECLDLSGCIECTPAILSGSLGGNRRYVSSTNGRL